MTTTTIPMVSCRFCGLKLIVPTNTATNDDAFIQRHIRCECGELELDRIVVERHCNVDREFAYKDRLANLFALSLKLDVAHTRGLLQAIPVDLSLTVLEDTAQLTETEQPVKPDSAASKPLLPSPSADFSPALTWEICNNVKFRSQKKIHMTLVRSGENSFHC